MIPENTNEDFMLSQAISSAFFADYPIFGEIIML